MDTAGVLDAVAQLAHATASEARHVSNGLRDPNDLESWQWFFDVSPLAAAHWGELRFWLQFPDSSSSSVLSSSSERDAARAHDTAQRFAAGIRPRPETPLHLVRLWQAVFAGGARSPHQHEHQQPYPQQRQQRFSGSGGGGLVSPKRRRVYAVAAASSALDVVANPAEPFARHDHRCSDRDARSIRIDEAREVGTRRATPQAAPEVPVAAAPAPPVTAQRALHAGLAKLRGGAASPPRATPIRPLPEQRAPRVDHHWAAASPAVEAASASRARGPVVFQTPLVASRFDGDAESHPQQQHLRHNWKWPVSPIDAARTAAGQRTVAESISVPLSPSTAAFTPVRRAAGDDDVYADSVAFSARPALTPALPRGTPPPPAATSPPRERNVVSSPTPLSRSVVITATPLPAAQDSSSTGETSRQPTGWQPTASAVPHPGVMGANRRQQQRTLVRVDPVAAMPRTAAAPSDAWTTSQ